MWNENAPLELLKELPALLNEANLARIQEVIDVDKFINSSQSGYDLCGYYAPFCARCDKSVLYPCAVAYVRMKQSEGFQVEMENIPADPPAIVEESAAAENIVEEAEVEEKPQEPVEKISEEAPVKRTIRIAVARRKAN